MASFWSERIGSENDYFQPIKTQYITSALDIFPADDSNFGNCNVMLYILRLIYEINQRYICF